MGRFQTFTIKQSEDIGQKGRETCWETSSQASKLRLTESLTGVKCRATSVAKNWLAIVGIDMFEGCRASEISVGRRMEAGDNIVTTVSLTVYQTSHLVSVSEKLFSYFFVFLILIQIERWQPGDSLSEHHNVLFPTMAATFKSYAIGMIDG